MNKPNHPPAGVLGIGREGLLPTGAYLSIPRLQGRRSSSPAEKSLAAAAMLYVGAVDEIQDGPLATILHSLRDRSDWTGPWYRRAVTALKYLARSICIPVRHSRFLSFIGAHPQMLAYRQRDPRLQERHMHRYVNAYWHRRQRLAQLHQHYRFALTHLPATLFEQVYELGYAKLGSLTAKDGSLLTLCMRPPILKGCEGELCLQLCDAEGHVLYSVVLTVSDETPSIMIGCLQGPRGENAKEVVRELTRNMHGLRPKQLMLSLVYAFARHYDIKTLLAIANDAHPLRRSGRPVHADYDAFWTEQHGKRIDGGWFVLPAEQTHKSVAEVPSHHRSAFRRREALRLQAEQMLIEALQRPAPSSPTFLQQVRQAVERPLRRIQVETSWVS